jgi:hypothetical protein
MRVIAVGAKQAMQAQGFKLMRWWSPVAAFCIVAWCLPVGAQNTPTMQGGRFEVDRTGSASAARAEGGRFVMRSSTGEGLAESSVPISGGRFELVSGQLVSPPASPDGDSIFSNGFEP